MVQEVEAFIAAARNYIRNPSDENRKSLAFASKVLRNVLRIEFSALKKIYEELDNPSDRLIQLRKQGKKGIRDTFYAATFSWWRTYQSVMKADISNFEDVAGIITYFTNPELDLNDMNEQIERYNRVGTRILDAAKILRRLEEDPTIYENVVTLKINLNKVYKLTVANKDFL